MAVHPGLTEIVVDSTLHRRVSGVFERNQQKHEDGQLGAQLEQPAHQVCFEEESVRKISRIQAHAPRASQLLTDQALQRQQRRFLDLHNVHHSAVTVMRSARAPLV